MRPKNRHPTHESYNWYRRLKRFKCREKIDPESLPDIPAGWINPCSSSARTWEYKGDKE